MHSKKTYLLCAIYMVFVSGSGCVLDTDLDTGSRNYAVSQSLVAEVRAQVTAGGVVPTPPPPPVSPELFILGQSLAFDKILSGNRNISCLTCHHPALGTGDDRSLPLGEGGSGLGQTRSGGSVIPRNAPALFNLHVSGTMFWDSRVAPDGAGGFVTPAGSQLTPEMTAVLAYGVTAAQALFPVTSRDEMRGQPGDNELADLADNDFTGMWTALMARLGAIPEYVAMFEAAYPGTAYADMTFAHAANAIAAFEIAAFAALDSPWERFLAGDDSALGAAELKGALDFFNSGCTSCHSGSALSDFAHHNTALAQLGPGKGDGATGTDDFGHERVSGDPDDRYAFRTPMLVNVELTAPYGHDGQFRDLRRFVRHYVDPVDSLLDYDIRKEVSDPALHSTQLDNIAEVLTRIAPAMDQGPENNGQVNRIVDFLQALTADSSRDLTGVIPDSVPSGLPVAD